MKKWIEDYLKLYQESIFESDVSNELIQFKDLCIKIKDQNSKILMAGNGASASIVSHAATDFTKQTMVRSIAFTDPNLITAYANDYGYEMWVAKAIESYFVKGDIVVLISSSGKSKNLVNAAIRAKELGLTVVTFTGFSIDNPLKSVGDINFWLNSKAYNIIECTHMIWITTVVDMIIGKAEYTVS
jgi:D-sedoheptulose 7-phosphate isomerase